MPFAAVRKFFQSYFVPQPKVTKRLVQSISEELELKEEIGSGRFGIVRVGIRKNHENEKIAVKSVPKTKGTLRELENEIRCLGKVSGHRNVMHLIDAFEDKTHAHILTPLYSGGELFDRIVRQRTFTELDAAKSMTDLLSALSFCHSKSVVHRDVKPENLLYMDRSKEAPLVLVDFGMAREFEMNQEANTMSLQCGSPSYVAPEVLERHYNEKCDTWSCGIILHILLVGKTPFGNGTDEEILSRVERFKEVNFNARDWDSISNEAKDLLSELLTRNPARRPSPQRALEFDWIRNQHVIATTKPPQILSSALENMREFNKHRRLKRAAIRVIAELVRGEDVETVQNFVKVISSLPRDETGKINLADLADIMLPIPPGLRVSDSGMVDPKELLASALEESVYRDEQYLLQAFKKFDVSGDGMIDKQELAVALGKDPKVDQDLVMDAMMHADKDGNGFITFEEFANVVRERTGNSEQVKKREATLLASKSLVKS